MVNVEMDNGKQYIIAEEDADVKKLLFKKPLFKELKNTLVEIADNVYINPSHIVSMVHVKGMYNMSRNCYQYIEEK